MKNKLLLTLFAVLFVSSASAQALQEIDMSLTGNPMSTYLTGINNRGMVCGYYTFASTNIGFVITAKGVKILMSIPGFTDTKAQAVNNNGVVLVSASNGAGSITPYRVYIDTVQDIISSTVAVTTMQQPSGVPYKMNDNNDITGWYQGASERWLWIDRDSLGGWDAQRYYTGAWPSYTYYNTYGQGINNNRVVGGYYIDGGLLTPFTYDGVTQAFNVITNAPSKTKIWAINNNGVVAGEYLQGNGYYMGFWGTISGTMLTLNSLTSLFQNATIQSVVNGINDDGDMVGAYLHPDGHWVGFIYRPTTPEFRIPGFAFATHTWRMLNSNAGTNPVWPNSYWSGFSYGTQDPYANNGHPLLDNYIKQAHNITSLSAQVAPDWISFCQEVDSNHIGIDPDPVKQLKYNTVLKHKLFDKYFPRQSVNMSGYCYGFSYSTLLRYFYDGKFQSWYNMPANTSLPGVTNSNANAIRAIARSYIKQMDAKTHYKWQFWNLQDETIGAGLFRLKNTYLRPFAESNPSTVAIQIPGGYHNILPYKIHTPQTFPFNYPTSQYDTIFIFDSNYPTAGDSVRKIVIKSNQWSAAYDSAWSTDYNIWNICLHKPGIRDVSEKQYSALKATSGPGDDLLLEFTLGTDGYYDLNSTNTSATVDASGFANNNTTDFTPNISETQGLVAPVSYAMDTTLGVSFHAYNYTGSTMHWSQSNQSRVMGLTRAASQSETDNGSQKNRLIAYANHDPVSKSLTGYLTETSNDLSQGVSLEMDGICAAQGDSLVTKNPQPYIYEVTRVNGTGTCNYHVEVTTIDNDSVRQYEGTGIAFDPNSTHTIDPYFPGPAGPTVVIIVDLGNNGSPDDTIQVTQVPLDLNNPVHYAPYVKVYPNPAGSFVDIQIQAGQLGNYNICLTDITGKVVYKNSIPASMATLQLPLTAYKTGTYLLLITNDNGQILYRDKLIKQ